MAQSTSDFIKEQDNKIKAQNPWVADFNYDELATPETLLDKIKKAVHKVNPKVALDTIIQNRNSKFNSFDEKTNTQKDFAPVGLAVEEIKTDEPPIKENDGDER